MALMPFLIVLFGFIDVCAHWFYARKTLRGSVRPNAVTWTLWSTAPAIGACAMIASGELWSALSILAVTISPAIVLISIILTRHAVWKPTVFDYLCGALSVAALLAWYLTDNPFHALLLSLCSDILAGVPTVVKSIQHPESESPVPYLASIPVSILGIIAAKEHTFSALAFPVYFLIIYSVLVYATTLNKNYRRHDH